MLSIWWLKSLLLAVSWRNGITLRWSWICLKLEVKYPVELSCIRNIYSGWMLTTFHVKHFLASFCLFEPINHAILVVRIMMLPRGWMICNLEGGKSKTSQISRSSSPIRNVWKLWIFALQPRIIFHGEAAMKNTVIHSLHGTRAPSMNNILLSSLSSESIYRLINQCSNVWIGWWWWRAKRKRCG